MHHDQRGQVHSRTESWTGLRSVAGLLVAALGVGTVLPVMEFNKDTDPAAGQKLGELRSNLEAPATGTGKEDMTAEDLDARYRHLRGQIGGLIDARCESRR